VSGSDPEKAVRVGGESPKPGRYLATIQSAEPQDAGGDPDRPMLAVQFEIDEAEKKANEKYAGSPAWYNLMLPGHPSYEKGSFLEQKLDQFLLAAGVITPKKRKGTFDPDDLAEIQMVIVMRPRKDDPNRTEVGAVLAYDEDTWGQEESDDEDEEADEDEIEESEDDEEEEEGDEDEEEEEEPEEDEEDEEEEEEEDSEYEDMTLKQLRTELEARELSTSGAKKTLIARLEEDDAGEGAEEDDEEEEEEEEEPAPKPRKRAAAKKPAAKRATRKSPAKRSTAKRGSKTGRGKGRSDFPFK